MYHMVKEAKYWSKNGLITHPLLRGSDTSDYGFIL